MNRKYSPTRTVLSLSALALLITGAVLYAGPLNPPAGPVTSTYKTLSEVEPRTAINATNTPGTATSLFKITQPGSYYLTGNITGVVGKHGIEIAASGVILDLNGFDLVGVPAMGAFDGVSATVASLTNIAVVYGSVRSWGGDGVDLGSLSAVNCRVEGVHASGNTNAGIFTGSGCMVTNCSAFNNARVGIFTGSGCTVSNCSAIQNTGTGISTSSGCTVSNCTASFNTGPGIVTGTGCTVSNCSAYQNTADGIGTGTGSTVSNCSAFGNVGIGINVFNGSTVADCTARGNTLDGIQCSSRCVIRGNTCDLNGLGAGNGAGILATGNINRIEGNNCVGADRGIDVDGSGNIIIGNTCSGNTSNWEIAIGNSVGPIVVAAANAAVISGNGPVTSTLGTTDPNANFSY